MKRMSKLLKKCCKSINGMVIGLMSAAMCTSTALASSDSVSGGALTEAAKQGAEGISNEVKNMLPWLLLIVIIIGGLVLVLLGRRGKESVKELTPQIIIGVGMIIFGSAISAWLFGLFKG